MEEAAGSEQCNFLPKCRYYSMIQLIKVSKKEGLGNVKNGFSKMPETARRTRLQTAFYFIAVMV